MVCLEGIVMRMSKLFGGFIAGGITLVSSVSAGAIELSFANDETIGGTLYIEESVLTYDGTTLSELIDGTTLTTSSSEDIDAVHIDDSGVVYFSTSAGATIGDGVGGIASGDIIRYDPGATVGSQFSVFLADFGPDVNAFFLDGSTSYVSLSVSGTVGSNALSVLDSQVYTLVGGVATVVFDAATLFGTASGSDVSAFTILESGSYLFSTTSASSIDTGEVDEFDDPIFVSQDSGFVYLYDPSAPLSFDPLSAGSVFLDSSTVFETSVNVDALSGVPEPASLVLIGLGTMLVLGRRRI